MKNSSLAVRALVTALVAALASPFVGGPAQTDPVLIYPLGVVERVGVETILPGDFRIKVSSSLGLPDRKLSADTWVYHRFQCQSELENAEVCSTLIVSFRSGRVWKLQRVNERAVRMMAAQIETPPAPGRLVAGM